ncbi:vomeronasal type-2 receptor 116-like [Microtus ochrogaster]|uniref:Vomeronasal type-2 receptor 116-like n=1 Tax=Microtus ochrogaster TaxID=79684 RepID=A0ABM0LRR0_MICOH|nr:vomeronasal type-2 receptor 116-like [Microtus ochrogaster]
MRRNQLPSDRSLLSQWAPEPFSLDACDPGPTDTSVSCSRHRPPHSLRHSMTLQTPAWAVLKGKRISSPQRKGNSLIEEKKELPANMLPDLHDLSLLEHGKHESNVDKCVRCPEDHYANREQNQCIPKVVVFLNYKDPVGLALSLMALCFSAFTDVVLGVFVKCHDTPIVKANNQNLSYILLISLILCFLCPLFFIGHPNSAICILQQVTFGVVFTVAVSTVLAKTVTALLAFKVTVPGRRMRYFLVSGAPNYIIVICTLIQVILCASWLQFSPPFIDNDAQSEPGQIIIVCNKGSVTAFYCVLGDHGSLALASFIVAFLARNLPDTFNEAKLLTFSMLLFCSVWVTFIPVYHSTKGKVMVVVEILSILISSAGLLGCNFIPKCYIILLRPERNSLQKLREKRSF